MNAFRIVAIVVSLLAWSVWLVAALHARGIHPIREVLSRWSRLGVFGKIAIAIFVAHLAIYGSTKPSGTNGVDQVSGTNDVEIVEGGNTNETGGSGVPAASDGGGASFYKRRDATSPGCPLLSFGIRLNQRRIFLCDADVRIRPRHMAYPRCL